MNKTLIYLITTTAIAVIYGCAQPVSPTGGDKDELPPVITSTTPINKSTEIKSRIFEFQFNENIEFNSPEKNIIISPKPIYTPTFKKNNKSIEIHFNPGSLEENTTYSVNFNQTVKDLNEGNIGIYPTYLFSTGREIDTLSIQGDIAYPRKSNAKNLKLNANLSNSITPTYTAQIIESKFNIYGLKTSPYNIAVYNDENNNELIDSLEDIGISINNNPTTGDTLHIKMYSRLKPVIHFQNTGNSAYITGLSYELMDKINNKIEGTFRIKDTLISKIESIDNIISSYIPASYIISRDSVVKKPYLTYITVQETLDSMHTVRFTCNQSIQNMIDKPIQALQVKNGDTSNIAPSNIKINNNEIAFLFTIPQMPETLIIPAGYIQGSTNTWTKDIEIPVRRNNIAKVTFQNPSAYTLTGTISFNDNVYNMVIAPNTEKSLYVPQGTYESLWYHDSNNDYIISPPNPINLSKGEPWLKVSNIVAKSEFDNVIILKIE